MEWANGSTLPLWCGNGDPGCGKKTSPLARAPFTILKLKKRGQTSEEVGFKLP